MLKYELRLYKPNSIIGLIICIITGSKYSHSAVLINGELWDSSESRGYFGKNTNLGNREYISFEFKGNLTLWLLKMKEVEYDWLGVVGWLFKANDKSKFYCFEASLSALRYCGITNINPNRVTADTLINVFKRYK